MWRVFWVVTAAVLVCAVVVWQSSSDDAEKHADQVEAPALPGPQSASPPARPRDTIRNTAQALHDPVVLSACSLSAEQEQEIASQHEGLLQGVHVRLGQQVRRGDLLGRLEDGPLGPRIELLRIKAASTSARQIAEAQFKEAETKFVQARHLWDRKAIAKAEYDACLYQHERAAAEIRKAIEDQEIARKELAEALRKQEMYEIHSGLDGEVVKVLKRSGEVIKPTEPLFRVASLQRLRIEGFCRVQETSLLRVGMRALVEPELPGVQRTELRGHTGTVTGLAVSADGRWVASASEDRTVLLWAWPAATRRAVLAHPAEVHAVVLSQAQLLTGCADGRLRAWSLAIDGMPSAPSVWSDGHQGAIRALAVSADWRWCASGGDDHRIGIWDLASGRRLYWLRATSGRETAHQGGVSSVHFTPDGQLVSAGRDKTIKVWQLGTTGGSLAASYPGRSGEVAQLGISPDGHYLLSDHSEGLRLLERDDGACAGVLACRRQGRFQGLALFSPTGRLILAAGSNGRLQLYRAPASPETIASLRQAYAQGLRRDTLLELVGGPLGACATLAARQGATLPTLWGLHGYEVRYYLAADTSALSCAAFAPDESVLFTAGTDQAIRVWSIPPAEQWTVSLEATIASISRQVERGTERVQVRAEMDNPADPSLRLMPGTYVDLRLYPETAER